jgi:hypothetical protein
MKKKVNRRSKINSRKTSRYWERLVANYKPLKPKKSSKPKPKSKPTMSKKNKAEQQELEEAPTPREGEEFLPPPDPPVVDSPPTEPPAHDAVEDIPQKGAQPEELAVRELNLTPEAPTAGPHPEETKEETK